MNMHFDLRTDGIYLRKSIDQSAYHFIKLFIEKPGSDQADNFLLMGTVAGEMKEVLKTVQENGNGNSDRIPFRFDDNDDTEIYWYGPDDWHYMITVHNKGQSIMLTRTHAKHKRESSEYVFHPFKESSQIPNS